MKKKLTPLMQQYWSIKSAHADKVLLFRMGDFFEMFHEDAVLAAPIIGIALTQRNKKAEDTTYMCGVPHHSISGPINKLLSAGHKVAICDQIEDPKQAKGIVKRAVTRILTPGMVYDPDELDADQPNYICSFDDNELVFYETTTFEAFYYQGLTASRRRSLIRVLAPAEVLLVGEQQLPAGINAHATRLESSANSPRECLKGYVEGLSFESQEIDFELRQVLSVMPLGSTVIRHLELFKTYKGDRDGTLFHCLNKTKSAPGARMLKQWMAFPLLDPQQINGRLNRVEEYYRAPEVVETLRSELSELYDIERRLSKIAVKSSHPRELSSLADSLRHGLRICHLLQKESWDEAQLKDAMTCVDKIDGTLADEIPQQMKNGGYIRAGFHSELDELIDLSDNGARKLKELEEREKEQTGIPSLKIRYNNVFGYYIEVTNTHKDKVPSHYLRKQTLTNAERYCTDELQELERSILSAKTRRLDLESEILEDLRNEILIRKRSILSLAQQWAEIDVLSTFAQLALERGYCRPEFGADLKLVGSRHPVVERGTAFVANTIELKAGQCLLLTGPNMAGKSTIMRQVAIQAIMAQMGSFVPAQQATQPVYDQIFTRIGASDHLTEGLSTFMVEMVEAAEIVEQSTENSLVVLDEIGRGTSTFDGMSLAQSLLEHLVVEKRSTVFFATHYHELTGLSDSLPQILNAHMAILDRGGRFEFLHTLKSGPANKSYGIHVAELAGLPKSITSRAKQLLKGHEGTQKATTQLSLLDQDLDQDIHSDIDSEWTERIRSLSLTEMTPLEVMNKIATWQNDL